jgi:acyl-CoA thioesterase I
LRRPLGFDPNRPVVCLGDSFTAGLADTSAYPLYMMQHLSVPVVNSARTGLTARDAVTQLPHIRAARPQVVIIELGGHDFLRRYGEESARESLVQIIEACREIDAEIVLIEIPRGFIVDPFSGLERELARTYDLELVSDTAIRRLVLRSPSSPLGSFFQSPISATTACILMPLERSNWPKWFRRR